MDWFEKRMYIGILFDDLYGRDGSNRVIMSHRKYQELVSLNLFTHYLKQHRNNTITSYGRSELRRKWDSQPTRIGIV